MNPLHLSLAFVFSPPWQLVSYLHIHWNIRITQCVIITVFINQTFTENTLNFEMGSDNPLKISTRKQRLLLVKPRVN